MAPLARSAKKVKGVSGSLRVTVDTPNCKKVLETMAVFKTDVSLEALITECCAALRADCVESLISGTMPKYLTQSQDMDGEKAITLVESILECCNGKVPDTYELSSQDEVSIDADAFLQLCQRANKESNSRPPSIIFQSGALLHQQCRHLALLNSGDGGSPSAVVSLGTVSAIPTSLCRCERKMWMAMDEELAETTVLEPGFLHYIYIKYWLAMHRLEEELRHCFSQFRRYLSLR